MFVIVSNTGNWDHDMWGVVAATENMVGFDKYVIDHLPEEDCRVRYIDGEKDCDKSFEEYEVNFLCERTPVGYMIIEPEGCFPDIYYLVELKS